MMGKTDTIARRMMAIVLVGLCAMAGPATAEDLKPKTVEAFDRYVAATESQINSELARRSPFLWIESMPEDRRTAAEAQ